MAQKPKKTKPVCPECGRKSIYFRTDGSSFCKGCGHDTRRNGEIEEEEVK